VEVKSFSMAIRGYEPSEQNNQDITASSPPYAQLSSYNTGVDAASSKAVVNRNLCFSKILVGCSVLGSLCILGLAAGVISAFFATSDGFQLAKRFSW